MTTSAIVDCSDDAQWGAYLNKNAVLRSFGHLRPRGTHELPVRAIRCPEPSPRTYPLVISGAPGAGKTALLDLLGVPAAGRLPVVAPGADPESGPEGLAAYADLVAARPRGPVLESSVRDTYGPYALRLRSLGFVLREEFKTKAIRAIVEDAQSGGSFAVYLATTPSARSWTPNYARDVDSWFARHYASASADFVLMAPQPADAMLTLLKRQFDWFFVSPQ